ncbi:MAG: hypothetical protein ACMXYD_00245 [Candidatus Woesearchaeota archaeon]
MLELLTNPYLICLNALITGLFTKIADVGVDDGVRQSTTKNLLYGFLWGFFASLVVLGSSLIAAFYFGILLSWVVRYKLDYYSHGIGGALVLFSILLVNPTQQLELIIMLVTFALFTFFGVLSREYKLKNRLGVFHTYNLYSFLFLAALAILYPQVWIVFFASLTNVIGYHFVRFTVKKQQA